jgi:hypothetical protein
MMAREFWRTFVAEEGTKVLNEAKQCNEANTFEMKDSKKVPYGLA